MERQKHFPNTTGDAFALEMGNRMGNAFRSDHRLMGIPYAQGTPYIEDFSQSELLSDSTDLENLLIEYAKEGRQYTSRIDQVVDKTPTGVGKYYEGNGAFATSLSTVSRCIRGGLHTQVYIIHAGAFDTHSDQQIDHSIELEQLATNILAFQREMESSRMADRVTILAMSEFGRRPQPRGTGTDHGTAAPVFLIGNRVHGGMHGVSPSISDLDQDGNLFWHIDFRSIYSSILE